MENGCHKRYGAHNQEKKQKFTSNVLSVTTHTSIQKSTVNCSEKTMHFGLINLVLKRNETKKNTRGKINPKQRDVK